MADRTSATTGTGARAPSQRRPIDKRTGEKDSSVFDRIVADYAGDQAGKDAVRLAATPLRQETIRGEPASVLIERSEEFDILMLGSRAYGPLRHVLMGSVSARVMREAHCPVVVVPRGVGRANAGAAQQEHAVD